MDELSQYNMKLSHRTGNEHGKADALCRMPFPDVLCNSYHPGVEPEDRFGGGCNYCYMNDQRWGPLTRNVDDPLTSGGCIMVQYRDVTRREPSAKDTPSCQHGKSFKHGVDANKATNDISNLQQDVKLEVRDTINFEIWELGVSENANLSGRYMNRERYMRGSGNIRVVL